MLIRWLGECSFLLQDSLGRRIITDPFDLCCLDKLLKLNPKLITLSHEHIETLSKTLEKNDCSIINTPGYYNLGYSKVEGFSTYHDKVCGLKRGYNNIYKLKFDNLNICHLGHLGHILCEEISRSLGNVDILFIPIGGHFSINGLEAALLVKRLKPKIVIPMYYRTSNSLSYLDSPKSFITSMRYVTNLKDMILDTSTLSMDQYSQTILMKESNLSL